MPPLARSNLFERAISMPLNSRKMRFFFRRYLDFEKEHGELLLPHFCVVCSQQNRTPCSLPPSVPLSLSLSLSLAGDESTVEYVKDRARDYVASLQRQTSDRSDDESDGDGNGQG